MVESRRRELRCRSAPKTQEETSSVRPNQSTLECKQCTQHTLRISGNASGPPLLWYVPHRRTQHSLGTLLLSPLARWHVVTASCAKLTKESVVMRTSSEPSPPTGTEAALEVRDEGRPLTNCLMKAFAARMLPFWRYLLARKVNQFVGGRLIDCTNGITPRIANRPNPGPEPAHCRNTSASSLALSRVPDERRGCSAASRRPSRDQ